MELAGEIADGLHTACAYSPEALNYAGEHFRLRAWAGVEIEGLPDLREQIQMIGEQVLPAVNSL